MQDLDLIFPEARRGASVKKFSGVFPKTAQTEGEALFPVGTEDFVFPREVQPHAVPQEIFGDPKRS
jgi:hypothetical protein